MKKLILFGIVFLMFASFGLAIEPFNDDYLTENLFHAFHYLSLSLSLPIILLVAYQTLINAIHLLHISTNTHT